MNSDSDPDMCDWEMKYNKQRKFTDSLISLFYSMKSSQKNNILPAVEAFEENNECDDINKCRWKIELDEKNKRIEILTTNLKCKDDELSNLRKQLNISNSRSSEMELQGMKSNEMKDKLKCEQELLSTKFTTVCNKLNETNIAFHEAKSIIKNNLSNMHKSVSAISELAEENEKNKITHEIQKLKDEKLCYMAKKTKELQQKNDYYVLKINKQKKQLQQFREKYMNDHDCYCFEKNFCNILQTLAKKPSSLVNLNN